MPPSAVSANYILSNLTRGDFRLLQPHLEAVELPLCKVLAARKKRVEQVYFLESGIASIVANGGQPIEVGIIGREGMSGISVVMANGDPAFHETYMQIGGKGLRLTAGELRKAIAASATLHRALLGYAYSFQMQVAQTALANGRSKIEERLARWLLMAHDRIDGDQLELTHEFLSVMLGVRRSGVTIALQELERKGLIANKRSVISILNRDGLEHASNGAYSRSA